MKRLQHTALETWFKKNPRKPLIIRGARQVGKSTLVRTFAQQNGLDLVEINLEKTRLQSTRQNSIRTEEIIQEALLLTRKKMNDKTLFFFDEIQEDATLLKWLRYFYEESPQIPIVSAGSLLELALHQENFSFPVGRVEFFHMGPMTFREFLWALGENILEEKIFTENIFSQVTHEPALHLLKQYLLVGGMPEAVSTYVRTKQWSDVKDIQAQILNTYIADFPKYGKRLNLERIQRVFLQSPNQLGKKLKMSAFDALSPAKEVRRVIENLGAAKILRPVYHAECGGIPLKATVDLTVQKTFFLDIGLANSALGVEYPMLNQEFSTQFVSKGFIAEQFVAQHLAHLSEGTSEGELFYWLRDKGTQKGEIDFVIQNKNKIIPIEVKSDRGGKLRSLFYFALEKKWNQAIKFSIQPFSKTHPTHKLASGNSLKKVEIHLTNIPLYAVETLPKILEKLE